MNWKALTTEDQLTQIKKDSQQQPILIFKHSTRCSISSMVLNKLERSWKPEEVSDLTTYHLDLIQFRSVSNTIAEMFGVRHESPQVLIISNGECVYHTSHIGITFGGITDATNNIKVA